MQCVKCLEMDYGVVEGIPKELIDFEYIADDALEFELQLAEAREVKFRQALTEPLSIGSHIVCTGTPCEDIPWFAINIGCGEDSGQSDIAVHFNVRMPQCYVVRNTRRNGKWGPEETTAFRPFPFKFDNTFTIEILVDEQQTSWAINGLHYCDFAHRNPSPLDANWVEVSGIKDATLNIQKTEVYPMLAPLPPEVPARQSVDAPAENEPSWQRNVTAVLPNGIPEGHQIVISGRLRPILHSFAIDLMDKPQEWPRPNIHAHVNLRAQDESTRDRQLVVLNAWYGAWGEERRQRTARLIPGSKTTFRLVRSPDVWAVYADGLLIGELEYRASPEGVKAVRLRGDLYAEHIYTCPATTSPVGEDIVQRS
ncbi:galectin-6-like isoform X2 [Hyposmocoma kahamanoa]|uniref:galectin-6-like isoform X2 n=1 Tax=Hyposmocoma kahamanoa TaxID=1477025 RepID=UPI000E6D8410|nr:galectin-6-like isoform X2 [Hyposmocoma kahamanoa]